jgi:hypothetical protein
MHNDGDKLPAQHSGLNPEQGNTWGIDTSILGSPRDRKGHAD